MYANSLLFACSLSLSLSHTHTHTHRILLYSLFQPPVAENNAGDKTFPVDNPPSSRKERQRERERENSSAGEQVYTQLKHVNS